MRRSLCVMGSLLAACLFAAPSAANAPKVKTLPQGESEVSFDDGCVVYFNKRGKQTHTRPGCSAGQIERATRALASGGHGHNDAGSHGGSHGGHGPPPKIVMRGDGRGVVEFENGCTVQFNKKGEVRKTKKACTDRQKARASEAMAAYRREQGHDGASSGSHHLSHGSPPEVSIRSDGRGVVKFASGCQAYFNSDGGFRNASSSCTAPEKAKAGEAMAAYRREQGMGSRYAD